MLYRKVDNASGIDESKDGGQYKHDLEEFLE